MKNINKNVYLWLKDCSLCTHARRVKVTAQSYSVGALTARCIHHTPWPWHGPFWTTPQTATKTQLQQKRNGKYGCPCQSETYSTCGDKLFYQWPVVWTWGLIQTPFLSWNEFCSHVNLFFFFWVVHYHERNKYKWVKIMVIRSIKRLNYIRSECILYMFSLVLEGCFPSIYSAPWSSIHILDQYWNTKPH